jgi:hypothetical protein
MTTIRINGRDYAVSVPDDMPLLWLIRDHLQMTGTMPIHLVWTREEPRCTGATWSDAVVIFWANFWPSKIERQAHALRARAPGTVVEHPPAAAPDPGEDDFEGGRMSGHFTCGACGRSHSLPEGAN